MTVSLNLEGASRDTYEGGLSKDLMAHIMKDLQELGQILSKLKEDFNSGDDEGGKVDARVKAAFRRAKGRVMVPMMEERIAELKGRIKDHVNTLNSVSVASTL